MNKKIDYIIFYTIIIFLVISFFKPIFALMGMLIALLYMIRNDELKGYCLLFFLLPFAQVFKISPKSTSLFTVLELCMIIKHFYIKPKITKKFTIYIGYVSLVSLLSRNFNFLIVLKMFLNLSLLFIFIDIYTNEKLQSITIAFSMGMIISSIIGIFKEKIPGLMAMYDDLDYVYMNGKRYSRYSGIFTDPNYYSIALIVNLGLIICYSINNKINLKNIFIGICLLIFGLFSYSKSYYLMLIGLILVIMSVLLLNKKIGISMFSIIVVVAIILSGSLNRFSGIQIISSRFSNSKNLNSLTTGRINIWKNYINYINSNNKVFFIGNGIGAPYYKNMATHNMYIETWYYIGVLGIVFYFVTLMKIFSHRIIYKGKIINYYLLFMVLIMYIFLAGFTAFEFPFYMMICWIVINTKLAKNKSEEI